VTRTLSPGAHRRGEHVAQLVGIDRLADRPLAGQLSAAGEL